MHKVAIFIQLITDIDFALGLLKRGASLPTHERNLSIELWLSEELVTKNRRAEVVLAQTPHRRISLEEIKAGIDLTEISALVCPTETTARPHTASRLLTEHARRSGLPTYTMQHGFDNIGLTYFDHHYPASEVRFCSSVVFTWGPLTRLHPDVPLETRVKCVPVGVPKVVHATRPLQVHARPRISVFENLHWDRYSDTFRTQFLEDLEAAALECPEIDFVIKPHPAGVWLTKRYKGALPTNQNILIASPSDPLWTNHSAEELITESIGVITTPSTIAVDAARAGVPTAVVGYDVDAKAYEPLMIIRGSRDWGSFARQCANERGATKAREISRSFIREHLIETDSLGEILSYIHGDCELRHSGIPLYPVVTPPQRTFPSSILNAVSRGFRRKKTEPRDPMAVIISFYNARTPHNLIRLLDALAATPAGAPFTIRVVVNRAVDQDLTLPARHNRIPITYRENTGYNIGAWDAGWRLEKDASLFLFLQDECQLARPYWGSTCIRRLSNSIGLLGENLSGTNKWDAPWNVIKQRYAGHTLPDHWIGAPDNPVERLECYFHFWREHNVELGKRGDHLSSLALFTSRSVLENTHGFLVGRSYGEAIASEIAISKRVQALGLRIGLIGKHPFTYFKHPQWSERTSKRRKAASS